MDEVLGIVLLGENFYFLSQSRRARLLVSIGLSRYPDDLDVLLIVNHKKYLINFLIILTAKPIIHFKYL